MSDLVTRLRDGMACAEAGVPCGVRDAASGCVCAEAADEIERLRAGGCARDHGTTQYCAEAAILAAKVGKLEAECFSLAAWQCEFKDGKTGLVAGEGGSTYCAMAREVEAVRAALAAARPVIRAEALEEAEAICRRKQAARKDAQSCAAAIRALKEKE